MPDWLPFISYVCKTIRFVFRTYGHCWWITKTPDISENKNRGVDTCMLDNILAWSLNIYGWSVDTCNTRATFQNIQIVSRMRNNYESCPAYSNNTQRRFYPLDIWALAFVLLTIGLWHLDFVNLELLAFEPWSVCSWFFSHWYDAVGRHLCMKLEYLWL